MSLTRFARELRGFLTAVAVLCAVGAARPAAAQLAIAVEANPGIALPGEQLEVQFTVSNPSVSNIAGVVLSVGIPAGLDVFNRVAATGGPGGCNQVVNDALCQTGETIVWSLGTLLAGQSVTVGLHPTVAAAASGSIAFSGTLTGGTGGSGSATVGVDAALTLDVGLHEARDPVAAGDNLVYTIHFGNASTTDTAPSAHLAVPVPAGTTFVSASDGGALNAGTVEWSLGTLQPGQSGTRTLVLAAGAGLVRGTLLLAQAELSDSSPQVAQARAVTEIDGSETLVVGMALRPDPVGAGEQIDLELTVTNTGIVTLGTVTLALRWPQEIADFNRVQATGAAGGCNQIVNDALCQGGEFMAYNLGNLLAGQSVTLSVALDLAAFPDGSIVDFETVVLSSGAENRTAVGRALAVDSSRQLELGLHEERDPVAAGGALVYTLHYGNASTTDAAPNALLTLPVPAGTTFVSASDGGGLNAGAVQWSLGTLQPGDSGTRTVVLATGAGLVKGSLILAQAELSDTSAIPQRARVGSVTEIDGSETLVVGMALRPDPVGVGEQIDLELTVTNTGIVTLGTVTLALRWPQEVEPFNRVLATGAAGGCNQLVNDALCQGGEFLAYDFGNLLAGQSVSVSVALDLAATPDGSVVDFETVVLSSAAENRTAVGRALIVDSTQKLQLGLHEERDPVAAGDELVYTLHYGNASATDAAPNALLRLPLPVGTTFVSASDGGSPSAGAVQWSLGTLQPGQSGTRTVVLATDGGLVSGGLILAQAELSDASATPQRARVRAVTEIDSAEPLLVGMELGPDPVGVGEQIDLELTVTNTGIVTLGTVTLVLRWPQEVEPFNRVLATGAAGGCNQLVNDALCQGGEYMAYNFGNLLAGQSVSVSVALDLAATPDGSVVDFETVVLSSAAENRTAVGRALAVDSSRQLHVGLHEDRDPIAAGTNLVYTLNFRNGSVTDTAPNALLRMPLPAGTSFVSASGGGSLNAGAVEWSLGTLEPQVWGTRTLTVGADPGLSRAALIRAEARLSDASSPPNLARTNAVTEIDALEALAANLAFTFVSAGNSVRVDLTVTNTDTVNHGTVSLVLRLPQEIQPFNRILGAGGCTQLVNDALCQGGEFLAWNLGTMLPSQSVTETIPQIDFADLAGGRLFEMDAVALGSGVEDRVEDKVVPEPGFVASLLASVAVLGALARLRSRREPDRR